MKKTHLNQCGCGCCPDCANPKKKGENCEVIYYGMAYWVWKNRISGEIVFTLAQETHEGFEIVQPNPTIKEELMRQAACQKMGMDL